MATPPWLAALNARSRAMNTRYGLPPKAPIIPPAGSGAAIVPPTQSFDPMELAKQQAQQWLQAQLDSIKAQKDAYLSNLQEQSDMEVRRGQAISQALQQLGIPQQIQTLYGNASSDIGGLAQAFSGSLRDTATQDAANETRMLSGTGQEGAVANNGAALGDVLYGSQGYIPARNMSEQGAAFASEAAMEPGFAQRIGGVKAADVYSQGLDGLKQFADMVSQANAQLPDMQKQAFDQLSPDLDHYQLANGQVQFYDKRTGLPVGKPQGMPKATSSRATKNTIRMLANGQLQAFNAQGKPVGKPYGPVRQSSSSTPKLQARSLANGQIQWFDPTTGQPVGPAQGPVRKTTKKGKNGQEYNLQLKTLSDGSQQWFDPRTGRPVGGKISPPNASKSKLKYTPYQISRFTKTAYHIAQSAAMGYVDADGTTHAPWSKMDDSSKRPKDVLQDIMGEGVPFDIAVKQIAKFFKPAKQWIKNGTPAAQQTVQSTSTSYTPKQAQAIETAYRAGPQSGGTYVFGAAGQGGHYDCSGYTMAMVAQNTGVQIPHNAHDQFVDPRGQHVPENQLEPGDVVFFRSSPNDGGSQPPWHCGYYIGGGKYIEYYSSGQPARVSLLSSRSDYMGARRFGGARA